MAPEFSPTQDGSLAEDYLRNLDSAASRTQLEMIWRDLKSNSGRNRLEAEVWFEEYGEEYTVTRDVTTYSLPDGTRLVSEGRHWDPRRNSTIRADSTVVPAWFSMADRHWVFDRGMPTNDPNAICGLLGLSTIVKDEHWAALALWWLEFHCIGQGMPFPESPKLTPKQRATLLSGPLTLREKTAVFNAPG